MTHVRIRDVLWKTRRFFCEVKIIGRENKLNIDTNLILASSSPRRKELTALTGLRFEVLPTNVDEAQQPDEQPIVYVQRLAEEKARAAAVHVESDSIILAADTIVVDGKDVLGKPVNADEAENMLEQLRDRTHQVYTAIALYVPQQDLLVTELCETEVPMRSYSDVEIQKYIRSGDPFDKAGAYAIQNRAFHPVEDLSGCYANVVGLPLCHLARSSKKIGLSLTNNIAHSCQQHLGYNCPVYQEILRA